MKTKKDGWFNTHHIGNADSIRCGNMICSRCGEKIDSGDYLIRERKNFHHRGNETDETYIYHRECSKEYKIWEEHDKKTEQSHAEASKREAKWKQLIAQIEEWNFTEEELFQYNY